MSLIMDAVADVPSLALAEGQTSLQDTPIALDITASLNDTDLSETLALEINNIPVGVTLIDNEKNIFTATLGTTSVDISDWDLSSLTLIPLEGFTGTIVLTVVEGVIGDFTSHVTVAAPNCTTGGATSATITPGAGNRYYLIVPLSPAGFEGSYGFQSSMPRPASLSPCATQMVGSCP